MNRDDTVKVLQKGDWWDAPRQFERLTLTLPADVVPGESCRLIIEARDQFGFTLKDFSGEVRLDADIPVTDLPDGVEFRPSDNGVRHIEGLEPGDTGILRITAEYGGEEFRSNPARVADEKPARHTFFGDIHCHIRERRAQAMVNPYDRDMGPATCEEFYRFARDTVGLDFCALTDHDVHLTDPEWEDTWEAAREFLSPGDFVTFGGYEWGFSRNLSKLFGHRQIIYKDDNMPIFRACEDHYQKPDDLRAAIIHAAGERGAIVCPHHPARGDLWLDWREVDDSLERLVEIYSLWGSSEMYGDPYRIRYICNNGGGYHGVDEAIGHHVQDGLAAGHRFGIIAGSECHDGRAGRALLHGHLLTRDVGGSPAGIMAVQAQELTRDSLWEAMWDRRTYATTGARILVDFSVNEASMGSEIECGSTNEIHAEVIGTDTISAVEIVRCNETAHTVRPDAAEAEVHWEDDAPQPGCWYYLRVSQTDGNMAWSSPVWTD